MGYIAQLGPLNKLYGSMYFLSAKIADTAIGNKEPFQQILLEQPRALGYLYSIVAVPKNCRLMGKFGSASNVIVYRGGQTVICAICDCAFVR
jgi:hypothetical protein